MKLHFLFSVYMLFNLNSLSQSIRLETDSAKSNILPSKPFPQLCSFDKLPIKSARTISFTTDEASYIDVDISPDGTTLLFSFLGNLYVLPVTGGVAQQITRGLAINRCPVWSPNGRLIAYESDASGSIRLHVDDTSGTFHKILGDDVTQKENFEPMWFPDSKQIMVRTDIHHLSGFSSSLSNDINKLLGFSADGNFMYYLAEVSFGASAVILSHRVTGEETKLLTINRRYDELKNARVSPDGTWFTYISSNSPSSLDTLIAVNIQSGNRKSLAELNIPFGGLVMPHYSFSTNPQKLYIGYGGKIHCIDIESRKNEIIPFRADVSVDMGPLVYNTFNLSLDSFNVKYVRSARRSPDGKHLVFSALNKLYLMDLPNGLPRALVNQSVNQFHPEYSPDGKWIAYVSWKDDGGGHLWRVPSNGGNPEQLTKIPGLYHRPSWSPDGALLVVVKGPNNLGGRDDPGIGTLQVISLIDKSVKNITDSVPLFNNPCFLSDNKHIVFKPSQAGADNKLCPRLVLQNIYTGSRRIIANAKKNSESIFPIRQIIFSPDGRYLVFMHNENLYLVPMSTVGSAQTIFDESAPITLIRFARGCIDPHWEDGGKVLSWINANQYCRIGPDKIIAAAEYQNHEGKQLTETKIVDVDIYEDEKILINLKSSRFYKKGIVVLTNARILTMSGDSVIENGVIVIKDGRITQVGKTGKVGIPKSSTTLNLAGKTIMPGLIDMHSHMYEAVPPDVFLQQSWQRILNLSYGVTTARDPSGSYDTFGYSELLEAGQMIGPRLFTVGHAVRPHYNLSSLNEAKVIVNNRAKMGAMGIKQYTQPTRSQRQLLLMACRQAGLNMTNEVEVHPLYCIGMIKDGSTGVEHNPEWGDIYKDIITFVAKSGTYLTPTLQVCYGREEGKNYFRNKYGETSFKNIFSIVPNEKRATIIAENKKSTLDSSFLDQSRIDAALKKAGGRIVLGSHGEDQGLGVHYELWALQMGGLTNWEALQTATISAAESLGLQNDLGSIEAGKIADLIVLDDNPLEDIHHSSSVRLVIKAGVSFDCTNLKRGIIRYK